MSFVPGRPTYRTLTANPMLAEMIGELDGIDEALAVDRQAEELITASAAPARSVDSDIAEIVTAGHVDPARVAELADHHARAGATESEQVVLREIRAQATNRLEMTVVHAAPELLRSLHGKLAELTEAARADVDTLDGITTAAAAIDAGGEQIAAWSALSGHRKVYDQIRSAQTAIMINVDEDRWRKASRPNANLPASANDAHIANLDKIFPSHRATKNANDVGARTDPAGFILRESISQRRINTAPWPGEPVAELAWLVAHAELWVPTSTQLESLWSVRAARDNERRLELLEEQKTGRKQAKKRLGHTETSRMDWHAMTGG